MVGITTGMKQLQRYLATGLVHRLGQGAVTLQVAGVAELIAVELRTPAQGRRGAAADDERHLLLGPEPIKGGRSTPWGWARSPVCIAPMITRFGRRVDPRSSGVNRWG